MYAFVISTSLSISSAVLVNYFIGNIGPYRIFNYIIGIGIYLLVTLLVHIIFKQTNKPFISGPNPKHLTIIVSGHLGHYSRVHGYLQSFKYHFRNNKNDIPDNIIVYLSRDNHNGFFFYTLWKTNDGINKGGRRLSNEIISLLNRYPSITKLSLIGCSLGGLYCRYSLKLLNEYLLKKNKEIEYINFFTMATPHIGVKEWTSISKCCCCCSLTQYSLARCLNQVYLLPPTISQLLLLDKNNIISRMCIDDEFIDPLKLFRNHICFGNAKHDSVVGSSSPLLLYGDKQYKYIENMWNKMESNNDQHLVEEVILRNDDVPNDINDNDCWFNRLNDEIKWKKIAVGWNQSFITKWFSHMMLAGPPSWYSGSRALFNTLQQNFEY